MTLFAPSDIPIRKELVLDYVNSFPKRFSLMSLTDILKRVCFNFIENFPRAFTVVFLFLVSCSTTPQKTVLTRDFIDPPRSIQEIFAQQGKGDYFLLSDEGYSFRLIYLCENRVLNFIDEPEKNPVLVSLQPVLDSAVEAKISPDDRRRVWACMERKVREENSRIEDLKNHLIDNRVQFEREIGNIRAEKERLLADISAKKRLQEEAQRKFEQEKRIAEEERQRRVAEEQRRFAEEERKIKFYRSGEKEDASPTHIPIPSPRATETGIFLTLKEAGIYEEPSDNSRTLAKSGKYDIWEVKNSARDKSGNRWHQIPLGYRVVGDKGKRIGWSPEEKSFWNKHKLLVWIYPGEFANLNHLRPLKMKIDEVQFTGKVSFSPQKDSFFEVTYQVNNLSKEEIRGWIEEKNGIRRPAKTKVEMTDLLKNLSKSLWPMRVQEDVLRGYLRQGFSREQVVLSWGPPDRVNTRTIAGGVHEQWVYGDPPFPKSYVYFENGFVKSWEFFNNGGD